MAFREFPYDIKLVVLHFHDGTKDDGGDALGGNGSIPEKNFLDMLGIQGTSP